jgi:hypothetical protein
MNHDFTLFKPELSDAEIQRLVEEDEAENGPSAAPADSDDDETDEDEDEDEDLGQIRLLLGRHWDTARSSALTRSPGSTASTPTGAACSRLTWASARPTRASRSSPALGRRAGPGAR